MGLCRLNQASACAERQECRENGVDDMRGFGIIRKAALWVRPKFVAVIEFLEWTEGDRLRHSKFVGLRDDKSPREVAKEA